MSQNLYSDSSLGATYTPSFPIIPIFHLDEPQLKYPSFTAAYFCQSGYLGLIFSGAIMIKVTGPQVSFDIEAFTFKARPRPESVVLFE